MIDANVWKAYESPFRERLITEIKKAVNIEKERILKKLSDLPRSSGEGIC